MEIISIITVVLVLGFIILVPIIAWYYQHIMNRTGKFPRWYGNKKLGKWIGWEITLYWFQGGRWELGLVHDINGARLISINLLFLYIEFEQIGNDPEYES